MNKMQKAIRELAEMDELAARSSPVHALHPAAKLIATILYILVTLSFDKYDLGGLVPMVLWPVLLFQISGIEVRNCFYKLRIVLPLVMAVGLVGMFFVRGAAAVMVAGTVMMSGHMMLSAALSALIRDWTPEGKVGHFQGIRMIFAVLLPMIIGPNIGAAVIRGSDSTYVELGQVKSVPTPGIYLTAALILVLCLVPVYVLRRREK